MTTETINILKTTAGTQQNEHSLVLGYYAVGDGGGGDFYWDNTSDQGNNDGTIISVAGQGRWKRLVTGGSINVKWFGAKGDGVYNDTDAIAKAAKIIEDNDGGTLIFPGGTYLVGGQLSGQPGIYLAPKPIVSIANCKGNVTITAEGCKIKFVSGLKFGTFDPATGAPYFPPLPFHISSYRADIGSFIDLENNSSVSVSGFTIDGNIQQQIIGGAWGDAGYQCRHIGVRCLGNVSVEISDVVAENFGLDGIYLAQNTGFSETSNHTSSILDDVTCQYAGRNGLSIVGGTHITVRSSKFNHTGNGIIPASAPGAGVDIEPEEQYVGEVVFNNCEFINNQRVGLLALAHAANIKVENCLFWAINGLAAECHSDRLHFADCTIYGSVSLSPYTEIKEVSKFLKFTRCHFEDRKHPVYGGNQSGKPMLTNNGCVIDACTFKYTNSNMIANNTTMAINVNLSYITDSFLIFSDNNRPDGSVILQLFKTRFSRFTIINDMPAQPATGYYVGDNGNNTLQDYCDGDSAIISTTGSNNIFWQSVSGKKTSLYKSGNLSLSEKSVTLSANYTCTDMGHEKVFIDASGAPKTVTLPAAKVFNTGYCKTIKKIDSTGNPVTINCFSGDIIPELATSTVSLLGSGDLITLQVVSNGAWRIVGSMIKAGTSPDSAPSAGTSYSQTQVQSILNELRDLKLKLRTARVLS